MWNIQYPENQYEYYYAISDHISDFELLNIFNNKYLAELNGKITKL